MGAVKPASKRVRKDPPARAVEHAMVASGGRIFNKKPGRHYVLIDNSELTFGTYLSQGYEPLECDCPPDTDDCLGRKAKHPTVLGARKMKRGGQIGGLDCSLLDIAEKIDPENPDEPSKERIEEYGAFGHPDHPNTWGGQKAADRLEKRMITNRGQEDPLRGIIGPRYARMNRSDPNYQVSELEDLETGRPVNQEI